MTSPFIETPPQGLTHRNSLQVADRHTVPRVAADWPGFAAMPPVFATAMMVAFIEETCIQALASYLAVGFGTVGTAIDMDHSAPTPVGQIVTAEVTLSAVDGRRLSFDVRASDGIGLIGQGRHQRHIIGVARFLEGVAARCA